MQGGTLFPAWVLLAGVIIVLSGVIVIVNIGVVDVAADVRGRDTLR